VPWDPASDGDLMFEMTAMVILDPSAPGCPVHQIKVADQFKGLFDPRRPMSEATGFAMAEWAKGQGGAHKQKEIMDHARDQARLGTAAFTSWWQSDEGKTARDTVRPIMDEIKALCAITDELANQSDDDPFSGPDDEQRGDAHTLDVEKLITDIGKLAREGDVVNLYRSWKDEILRLDETDRDRIDVAYDQAIRTLKDAAK
jgi:hypothetical protein